MSLFRVLLCSLDLQAELFINWFLSLIDYAASLLWLQQHLFGSTCAGIYACSQCPAKLVLFINVVQIDASSNSGAHPAKWRDLVSL